MSALGILRSTTSINVKQIHVDRMVPGSEKLETTTAARKLMHRFKEAQVLQLMDEVEKSSY